jgi:hypothetical protein
MKLCTAIWAALFLSPFTFYGGSVLAGDVERDCYGGASVAETWSITNLPWRFYLGKPTTCLNDLTLTLRMIWPSGPRYDTVNNVGICPSAASLSSSWPGLKSIYNAITTWNNVTECSLKIQTPGTPLVTNNPAIQYDFVNKISLYGPAGTAGLGTAIAWTPVTLSPTVNGQIDDADIVINSNSVNGAGQPWWAFLEDFGSNNPYLTTGYNPVLAAR